MELLGLNSGQKKCQNKELKELGQELGSLLKKDLSMYKKP